MLNIALPKGRLGDQVYKMLSSIGYECAAIYEDNRKLVFESPENGVRYLLVKPSDVAIYVEHGAADVGIVGKESELSGYDEVKISRLTAAGAHILCDCFAEADEIFEFIEG